MQVRVLLLHEFVDHGHCWTSADPLHRDSVHLTFGPLVFNIVRMFDVMLSELVELKVLSAPRREIRMAALTRDDFIARRMRTFVEDGFS